MTAKHNLVLREFGAMNTQTVRQVISDKEFSWLGEWMPISNGNMRLLPGPSAALATITVANQSIYYIFTAVIGVSNYLYCFLTDGSAYEVNTDTNAVVKWANAGTFAGFGTRCAQWKNERILIVDPSFGYFDYDRLTLVSYKNKVNTVAINLAGGGFTSAPTITPSFGSATFSSTIGVQAVTLVAAGTGYVVGDILLVSGGTYTQQAQIKVTGITAGTGAITGAILYLPGAYTVAPSNAVSVTGGYGTLATFNLGFALESVTVTNHGNGEYLTAPTLLINTTTTAGAAMPISNAGNYSVLPGSTGIATTGGTGAGLTANVTYGLTSFPGYWNSPYVLGYQIGDVLNLVGGTFTTPAQIVISNIVGSIVQVLPLVINIAYYYNLLAAGNYSSPPSLSSPIATTGGHGTGLFVGIFTSPPKFGVTSATVNASGAGYTNNDTLTLVGGTGSPATFTYKTGGASFGAQLTANMYLSISGSAIASYAERVWLVTNSRTVVYSAPNDHEDFTTANAGGSFILSDETMRSAITALKSVNDYLYIAGNTAMFIVSGVSVQAPAAGSVGNPITTFGLNNITTSFGTDFPDAILPHYRSLLYGSDYGWYMLTGVTPQKISDPLDGFLNNVNLTGSANITSGQCIVFGQLCECWLVNYTDPATATTTPTILIYFNNKWFVSVQGASLKLIVGGIYNDTPTLFGTDGSNIYRLFADSTTKRNFKVQTKLWDMGNPLMTKQVTRLGMEVTTGSTATFAVGIDTEEASNTHTVAVAQAGYYFARENISATGNYVGLTITGSATPGDTISGLFLEYAPVTPWVKAKASP